MVLYINCAIHAPGVKFGHAPGVDSLHRLTMGNKKNIICIHIIYGVATCKLNYLHHITRKFLETKADLT